MTPIKSKKSILLVEDDRALSMGIKLALQSESLHIEQCYTLEAAKAALAEAGAGASVGTSAPAAPAPAFDLILLDINLPDGSGLEWLCQLKTQDHPPVILLTANDLEIDIVTGLEMGAEDYITKPFSLAVLRARVNTQLRKTPRSTPHPNPSANPNPTPNPRSHPNATFTFDFENMQFNKGGRPLDLSKTEQRLLKMLVDHRGITLTRNQLQDRIWSDGMDYVDPNALSVTVKRLRDKLEDNPSKPQYIKTVYGIGYQWSEGGP